MTHDAIVQALIKTVGRIPLRRVSDAFVAGLTSAPLEYRSSLKSWAYAANFPSHSFVPTPDATYQCAAAGDSDQ